MSSVASEFRLRRATLGDLPTLLEMMPLYYADDHLDFVESRARAAMSELIAHAELGGVFLIEDRARADRALGYLAYCTLFSVEFGGRGVLVDEFYVRAESRGNGIGSRALLAAIEEFRKTGYLTVRLETTPTNARAHALYERLGFRDLGRALLDFSLRS